jgi:quercetin dioxygenase-like cupin family protein
MEVFDCRTDIRNIFVAPEMRARFIRRTPGTESARGAGHTHELGHEIFLVLEGQAELTIEGETAILTPGQCAIARADQWHSIRAYGDEPLTYYLSVTPHIEPTHTHWDAPHGTKLPYRYGESTREERRSRTEPPEAPEVLLERHLEATRALADVTASNAAAQEQAARDLRAALASGDRDAGRSAIDAMWQSLYATYKQLQAMENTWNELAPVAAGE